jgi:hypothetical protein
MPDDLDESPRCAHCGYPLAKLTESRCPECGRIFNLADPATFNPPPVKIERNWTLQELLAFLGVSALFAVRPHDVGELVYEIGLEAAILYALALFFAVVNDKYWLTPLLFFLGVNGICWAECWREASGLRGPLPFFQCRLLILALIVSTLGSLALAGTKAEVRAARRKGQSSRLMNLCERLAGGR